MGRFYISIGSNINPEKNVVLILKELLKISPSLSISRILQTKAVDVESDNYFLNLCASLNFPDSASVLTQKFKEIERKLGRDIDDAERGKKDRTADIDILFAYDEEASLDLRELDYPSWVMLPLADLLKFQNIIEDYPDLPENGTTLTLDGIEIGAYPVTIER